MFKVLPDDPIIQDMDPVLKIWMYEHWLADHNDQIELAKNHAYLIASFDHPEEVKQLSGGGNIHVSSEEEFEESSRIVRESSLKKEVSKPNIRKRRRQIIQE